MWADLLEKALQFRAQSLNFQETEHEFVLLESRLLRKEQDVYQKTQKPRLEPSPTDQAAHERERTPGPALASQANTEHPLVAQYYASFQEATRLRDSLINFEASHVRRKATRDRKSAEGAAIEPLESMFIQKYLQGRKIRLNRLLAANKEMNQLWEQCLEQNLEIELPNLPPIGDDDLLNQLSRIPKPILDYVTSTSGHTDFEDRGALLVEDWDSESRITTWLNQVGSPPGESASTSQDVRHEEKTTSSRPTQ